jgi:type I restriction enzyme S subunit
VVFGDHTRVVKLVNSRFVAGADGTKLLFPDPSRFDPVFFYFALRGLDIPSRGYNRHWRLLADMEIPVPPPEEQRRIARILSTIQRSSSLAQTKERAMVSAKSSIDASLFKGVEAEAVMLADVASIERGRFTHRPRNDPRFYGGSIPFIQTGDVTSAAMADGFIRSHSQTLNERGLEVSRLFPAGTIAITIAANIGYVARLRYPAAFPDSIIAITPTECMDAAYLSYYLATQQAEMDRQAPRGTQKNINIEFLKPWPVPLPSLTDQRHIARVISTVDRAVSATARRRVCIDRVFGSAQAELLGGLA